MHGGGREGGGGMEGSRRAPPRITRVMCAWHAACMAPAASFTIRASRHPGQGRRPTSKKVVKLLPWNSHDWLRCAIW